MAAAGMVFLSVSPSTKARADGDTIVVDKGTLGRTQQPADPGTPPGGTSGGRSPRRSSCGPLTDATTARIQALPLEQLEALADALLDFTGPADLATWLAEHKG